MLRDGPAGHRMAPAYQILPNPFPDGNTQMHPLLNLSTSDFKCLLKSDPACPGTLHTGWCWNPWGSWLQTFRGPFALPGLSSLHTHLVGLPLPSEPTWMPPPFWCLLGSQRSLTVFLPSPLASVCDFVRQPYVHLFDPFLDVLQESKGHALCSRVSWARTQCLHRASSQYIQYSINQCLNKICKNSFSLNQQ